MISVQAHIPALVVSAWIAAGPAPAFMTSLLAADNTARPARRETVVAERSRSAPAADGKPVGWTRFRGPNGQGRLDRVDLPVAWSESRGVLWKTPIEGKGWSSPVIQDGHIWLTTATESGHSLRAVCVEARSGRIERDVEVFQPATPVSINAKNTYASPSPVVEPGFVYVHFGAMGTACLAADTGKVVWRNQDLVVDHKEGPGSSPILFENLLIVNCDGQDRQFVVALDKRSGRIVWKTKRSAPLRSRPDFRKAFSTPALIQVGERLEIVSTGADQVNAYDPRTGEELWRVRYVGFSNVPVPVVDRDRVYVVTDFTRPQLWAILADGRGDVTDTKVLWKLTRQVGASPSPVLLNGSLYLISDHGVVTAVDAETGKPKWQHRLGGTYSASVLALGNHLYFESEQGKITVLRPGDSYRPRANNTLEGGIFATPAVYGQSLLIRTETHLYRIGGEATAVSKVSTSSRQTR